MSESNATYNLAGNFARASLIILIILMLFVGWWINNTIQKQVIDNTAINAALYAQSFIAPELQGLNNRTALNNDEIMHLEHLLAETPLGRKIRSLKIWTLDGQLLYHPQNDMIGQRFEPTESLVKAANGQIAAEFDEVDPGKEDFEEAKLNIALLEIYTPIKHHNKGNIIAIAEFYQEATELAQRLDRTRFRAWLIVVVTMLLAYGLLYSIVWRGSSIIHEQAKALRAQVLQLSELLQKNKSLSSQLRRSLNSNTENNEKFLTRLSADLHDGPAQYIGFALLRLDALTANSSGASEGIADELRKALSDSLTEIRNISKGMALPNLETMSVQAIVSNTVKAHQQRTGSEVEMIIDLGEEDLELDMPMKITLYRSIQEGLTNAYRHADGIGQQVHVQTDGKALMISIKDNGNGFEVDAIPKNGDSLGLNGLRERVKGLGGQFSVDSQIGNGTILSVNLPLMESE